MWKRAVILMVIFVTTACGVNDEEKAIKELLRNQIGDTSVHVFTNRSLDDEYIQSIQRQIDYINNQLKPSQPILNVSFNDIRESQTYDYKEIFQLESYPQLLLFVNDKLVLQTNDPNELSRYYEDLIDAQ